MNSTRVAALLLFSETAWADVDLPIYSSGFGGLTVVVALPLVILGEAAVLWLLTRKGGPPPGPSVLRVSAKANLASGFFGFFINVILGAVLNGLWHGWTGGGREATVFMRQVFFASFFATVALEALVYQKSWSADGAVFPERRFWFWSLAANSASYGVVAWLLVSGSLRDQDLFPFLWYHMARSLSHAKP